VRVGAVTEQSDYQPSASSAPTAVVFTDWESTMPALG
jgi:hypothetical protein